jgi:hypothetical protein
LPIILDYKTTKTEEGEPIVIYPAYQMQIAAYWNAAYPSHSGSGMGGYNIFISSTEPGRVEAHWYDGEELEDAWKEFGLPRSLEAGQEVPERLVNPKT